ncbi:hypothetical protein IscW_ISCW008119 [Ixodes scapularis]|uniref:RNase H type-1 domain-containing protein n=1 Tax=Ixodes scapularis TaxID=6945 RepID=B7PUT6_IXOSC|nr:hypothetical protein IscW_ISCW008119 [Ixodes scapularis]|eukprot:XP_002406756.1 hypothetical protein IscW_ISCW008119 [Ixodes scapularis]
MAAAEYAHQRTTTAAATKEQEPDPHEIRIFTDGTWNPSTQTATVAMYARGGQQSSKRYQLEEEAATSELELRAIMLGLQRAKNLGLKADAERITVHIDRNEVNIALHGPARVGTTEHTIQEIGNQLLTDKDIAGRAR